MTFSSEDVDNSDPCVYQGDESSVKTLTKSLARIKMKNFSRVTMVSDWGKHSPVTTYSLTIITGDGLYIIFQASLDPQGSFSFEHLKRMLSKWRIANRTYSKFQLVKMERVYVKFSGYYATYLPPLPLFQSIMFSYHAFIVLN